MAQYARSQYNNLFSGVNPNAFPGGWGSYQYPGGVPNSLLGQVNYNNGKTSCSFVMRKELVELCGLCLQIADKKFGYQVWGSPNPGTDATWGPWAYENRTISGSSTPSNHSKGRAWDWNAPYNSYTGWSTCEIPPGLVQTMQELGWYWGGFYGDRMHFEYVKPLSFVATAVAKARQILGQKPTPPKPPAPKPPTPVPADHYGVGVAKKTAHYNPGAKKSSFPLAKGHVFGDVSGPNTQHSGDPRYDGESVRAGIRQIQAYGQALGRYTAALDGLFGPSTLAFVKWFQAHYTGPTGKLAVDGIVGPKTWNAMGTRVGSG